MTTNKQLQEWLKQFPDDAEVMVLEEHHNGYDGYSSDYYHAEPDKNCFVYVQSAIPTIYLGEN